MARGKSGRAIARFVWGTNTFPLKRAVLHAARQNGGLDSLDLLLWYAAQFAASNLLTQQQEKEKQRHLPADQQPTSKERVAHEAQRRLFQRTWQHTGGALEWRLMEGNKPLTEAAVTVRTKASRKTKHAKFNPQRRELPDHLREAQRLLTTYLELLLPPSLPQENPDYSEKEKKANVARRLYQQLLVRYHIKLYKLHLRARATRLPEYLTEENAEEERRRYFRDGRIPHSLWETRWLLYHHTLLFHTGRPAYQPWLSVTRRCQRRHHHSK